MSREEKLKHAKNLLKDYLYIKKSLSSEHSNHVYMILISFYFAGDVLYCNELDSNDNISFNAEFGFYEYLVLKSKSDKINIHELRNSTFKPMLVANKKNNDVYIRIRYNDWNNSIRTGETELNFFDEIKNYLNDT